MKVWKYLSIVIIGSICWWNLPSMKTHWYTGGDGVIKTESISIPMMFLIAAILAFILISLKSFKK